MATKSEGAGLIVRAISFQDFQLTYVITNHQRYRQTTCDRKTALCTMHSASRGKNEENNEGKKTRLRLKLHNSDLQEISNNVQP